MIPVVKRIFQNTARTIQEEDAMPPLEEDHYASDDVRGGSEEHVVRYVLGFSLALAITCLTTTWMTGAMMMP
ncbi:hypothetical protein [Croceicoccus marinus]|uniref:Uncharacterized protein n=1 Tax=Croceicoccus marinus TaxID=450378 RepID=A0A7G6VYI0_9SPHN|nr:hypothetical protein [Croceicoccus marinus]QNE06795.1 hypothetical protein H4O24_11055 [Croceicoccus marinus]